jgi:hypothetical protein
LAPVCRGSELDLQPILDRFEFDSDNGTEV